MALNSTSSVRLVDLLCEGPIEGFDFKEEQIFLDETPLKTGGEDNFSPEDVNATIRLGGQTQGRLPQAGDATTTITAVGVEVGQNYSETLNENNEVVGKPNYGSGQVIRQITDPDVTSIQLLFTIPRLFSTAQEGLAKGQPFNGVLDVQTWVQRQGGPYNMLDAFKVAGVALTDYQRKTKVIELPRDANGNGGPWNIKVVKVNLGEGHFEVTRDSLEEVPKNTPLANGRANQLIWSSIIERQEIRSTYPYTACVGLELNTRQFSNLPSRAYLIKGRRVEIPHNAAVREDGSLDLTKGVTFNGDVHFAWTTCPVCIFRDMLLNDRYGCGDFVKKDNISMVDFYPLIQYANQLVTNQDGTTEPRFACNVVIGDRAAAYNVLQDLASVFRGMSYWSANTVQLAADHGNLDGSAVDPVHLYTNSNVVGGIFNYSGSSLKTRSTSIRVRYNDPDNFYKPNFVVVEDAALITKYGYQVREVVAFGCTSRNQAYRLGRWMMASEELDGETVTFSTGLQGAIVLPGQVFAVADEMRQGARIAGRCSAATTTTVTADITVTLPGGAGHTLTATLPDGTIETKTISSVIGSVITVSDAFSAAPLAQSIWSIQSSTVAHQKFRCISVADGGDGTFAIVGVQHNDSIYATADNADALEYQSVTTFDQIPTAPSGLTFETKEVRRNNNVVNDVFLSFLRPDDGNISGYEIRYKVGDGNFETVRQTTNILKLEGVKPGSTVTFQIRSFSRDGTFKFSAWTSGTFVVPRADQTIDSGTTTIELPPDPREVQLEPYSSNQVRLTWRLPVAGLGATSDRINAEIRHSSKTDGSGTWPNSSLLTVVKAATTYAILPELQGEYLVRFIDDQNKKSANVQSVVHTLTDPQPRLLILEDREDTDSPEFQGQKNNTFYSEEYDALVIDGDETIDDILDIDALSSFDFLGTRKSSGEYFFANTLDLGAQYDIEFSRHLVMRGTYPADDIDERTALIDTWTDFDGLEADDVNAEVYLRAATTGITAEDELTEDGDKLLLENDDNQELESNLVFGDWVPLQNGHFQGRLFQFKCELSSDHVDQTPLLDELGFTAKMPLRTETSAVIASGTGAGGKAVTFTNAFFQDGVYYNTPPSIGITAFNLASGDYYEVTSISRTGFTVKFKNSSNAVIDRNFQYQAVGYGSERS